MMRMRSVSRMSSTAPPRERDPSAASPPWCHPRGPGCAGRPADATDRRDRSTRSGRLVDELPALRRSAGLPLHALDVEPDRQEELDVEGVHDQVAGVEVVVDLHPHPVVVDRPLLALLEDLVDLRPRL